MEAGLSSEKDRIELFSTGFRALWYMAQLSLACLFLHWTAPPFAMVTTGLTVFHLAAS